MRTRERSVARQCDWHGGELVRIDVPGDGCKCGPCAEGTRLVVGNEVREPIRLHHDIERETVQHFKRASKLSSMNQREHFTVDLTDHIVLSCIVL